MPGHAPVGSFALVLALALGGCGSDPSSSSSSDDDSSSGPQGTSGAAPVPTTGSPTTSGADLTTSSASSGSDSDSDSNTPACDPAARTLEDRDLVIRDEPQLDVVLPTCSEHRWYFVGASESTLELTLRRRDGGPVEGVVAYPNIAPEDTWGQPLTTPLASKDLPAKVVFPVPRSGEFTVHVRSEVLDGPALYDLEVRCLLGCDRETTRFPVVLVHGWTGFEAIGPLTYFFNVRTDLEDLGYPLHVAILDPYNHTNIRAGQLAAQVDDVLIGWRARKVNLLGHSQGGIDSRAVASSLGYGDRVSAVMTIASPHRGTYITDLALGIVPGPAEQVVGALLNFIGAVTAQQKSDALASFYSLTEQHMQEEFNPNNPDDPRVQYISYTGRTCDALAFLNPANDCQDLCDPLLGWGYTILDVARGANDGLVTVDSAKWGDYRGEMIADHIDEVGHLLGVTDLKFNHITFYRDRARELANEHH